MHVISVPLFIVASSMCMVKQKTFVAAEHEARDLLFPPTSNWKDAKVV